MKKLLFATALVASAAAFADPTALNAISFEGYTAGATFANGATEKGEDGNNKSVGPYFYYDGEQDGSSVKAFGGENAVAPSITRPFYFASASPDANYLDLSTEGGILWRSINDISQTGQDPVVYGLGQGEAIAADGLYLDTLVQFTPTEDGGDPELGNEDKLAIWLSVNEGVTNLMVRAGYADAQGTFGKTNFVLTGVSVQAGQWYRLTVKAYENILKATIEGEPAELKYGAFSIFIDGTEMSAAGGYTLDSAWSSQLSELYLDGMASKIQAGSLFVSCVEGVPGEPSTLAGVGFKGSGALDDIVWTTEDPFANSPTPGGYSVEIGGSPVPITLSAEEVEALGDALFNAGITGTDLTTTAGVNAALATTIGSTGIPAWQAFFLGLPLTEAGLESFKITSIGFNEDGDVLVTLPASVTLLTGHGVNIVLSLQGSDDLSTWDALENATVTNNKPSFAAVEPGANETKKFYKVVVSFVQTPVVE